MSQTLHPTLLSTARIRSARGHKTWLVLTPYGWKLHMHTRPEPGTYPSVLRYTRKGRIYADA